MRDATCVLVTDRSCHTSVLPVMSCQVFVELGPARQLALRLV